jgi:hypothetical protein
MRNRGYLVLTLILPPVLPLLKIPLGSASPAELSAFLTSTGSAIADSRRIAYVAGTRILPDYLDLVALIYLTVAVIFLARVFLACLSAWRIIRRGNIVDKEFPKLVVTDQEHPAFSFFSYIVMTRKTFESNDLDDVVAHESTHVRQLHTIDLMLCEVIKAFQWFNPLVYYLKRSIVLNHEYIADHSRLGSPDEIRAYQYALLRVHTKTGVLPVIHSFSSLIKNRLVMINKKPTSRKAIWKNLVILPVLAVLMLILSCETGSLQTENQKLSLSDVSQTSIRRYLQENIVYPQEARSTLDTGMVFVVLQMDQGGTIKECRSYTDQSNVDAPMLGEIVITGYTPAFAERSAANSPDHAALITECERVANQLVELDIPEWAEGNTRFTLVFHFRMV